MLKGILDAILVDGDIESCLPLLGWLEEQDDSRLTYVKFEIGKLIREAARIKTVDDTQPEARSWEGNTERKYAMIQFQNSLRELFWWELSDDPLAVLRGAAEALRLRPVPDPEDYDPFTDEPMPALDPVLPDATVE